jgi:16S rRNA processing protein RimM
MPPKRKYYMIKKYLEAGKIVSTFGIHGEVNILSYCSSPEVLCGLDVLYLKSGDKLLIERSFVRKNNAVAKFEGIDTVEAAQKYRDKMLYLDRDDVALPENGYFYQDLLGINVIDFDTGIKYGEIVDITFTGSHDVYHVKSESGGVNMIPAVSEFIIETDIEKEIMKIKTIEGLISEV